MRIVAAEGTDKNKESKDQTGKCISEGDRKESIHTQRLAVRRSPQYLPQLAVVNKVKTVCRYLAAYHSGKPSHSHHLLHNRKKFSADFSARVCADVHSLCYLSKKKKDIRQRMFSSQ